MTEVHTVSIVAKNKYSGRAGVRAPKRGGTKVRKPFTRVQIAPAMIFASRFALNGSSRHATIMAMGISIKAAEPPEPMVGDVDVGRRLHLASQQFPTGQARPHKGSSKTRRSKIGTTAPLCHACQPPTELYTGPAARFPHPMSQTRDMGHSGFLGGAGGNSRSFASLRMTSFLHPMSQKRDMGHPAMRRSKKQRTGHSRSAQWAPKKWVVRVHF